MASEPSRRSTHRTQWAAQFAVASELCKRGYEVAFTMGNHPSVDIMATSPGGVQFGIDVKGLYRRNDWAIRPKAVRVGLFYVLAFVPDDRPNRFFVLSQREANAEIVAESARALQRAREKGRSDDRTDAFPCINWRSSEVYENAWGSLPA